MQIEKSEYQAEPSDFRDLGSEFIENRATVREQIKTIQSTLLQYNERITKIEEALKQLVHIETIQNQLTRHDSRMTRIESDWKSLIKWWILATGTISGAIIGAAKLFFGQ